ncbi:carbon monoxide dehydrogenase subunit G (plasmid) [Deinococcus sp. KNUC1210]|uniref:SRPBCC family protein n=1 Tax=Deinococcus sp. KNUC1210 TaxID=2917691 RepID=UPI001EF11C96|nr:carbon monoxide dehydrogenase subunit G [Deinococcus sp. KNUC1210]ULH17658.1 carbon monoxide dehydrogenase subunit G [Deinococcus sp. KNUC1210]
MAPTTTFQGSNTVAASRDRVWEMLQDPEVLAQIIPGLSDMVTRQPGQFQATLSVNVGPVKGKFKAGVHLTNLVQPQQMNLQVEARNMTGGVNVEAQLNLTDLGESTRVDWVARPQLSGILAGVGGKLIESKAREPGAGQRYADRFFSRLAQQA